MPVGALAVLGGGTEKSSGSAVGCAGVREGVLGVPKTPPPRGPPLCVPATVSALQPRWLRSSELTPPAPLPMFSEPPGSPPAPPALPPIPRPRCGPAAARCANGGEWSGAPSVRFHRPQHSVPPPRPPPPLTPPRPGMEPGAPAEPRCRLEPWQHYEPGPAVLCALGCVLGLLYGCVGEGWGWHSAGGAPSGVGGGDSRGRLWDLHSTGAALGCVRGAQLGLAMGTPLDILGTRWDVSMGDGTGTLWDTLGTGQCVSMGHGQEMA